jgi:hypothetical protein
VVQYEAKDQMIAQAKAQYEFEIDACDDDDDSDAWSETTDKSE